MKILSAAMCLLFVVAMAVQLNDPDPLRWVLLYGIAAALPGFLEQGSGHIINLSSVAGIKVFAPGGTVYSGTKFAVSPISEGMPTAGSQTR